MWFSYHSHVKSHQFFLHMASNTFIWYLVDEMHHPSQIDNISSYQFHNRGHSEHQDSSQLWSTIMVTFTYKLSNLSPKLMKLCNSGSSPLNNSAMILLINGNKNRKRIEREQITRTRTIISTNVVAHVR